jgi:signal transduction histidine kinase
MGGSVQVHEIEEFDLAEFMSTYVLSLMARRDVGVRITTPVTRERTVIASEPKVLQLVLDNLCKNSFEAMPRGGDLKIDWVLENDWVLIEVQDSGTGMPQKLLRAILDGEPVQSAKRSGSGIGMLSVIALLRSVGGRFDGSSLEGKGTSWIISLPIREAT